MEILWEFVGREKKAQFEKKGRGVNLPAFRHMQRRSCKDPEDFKIPISVSVGVFCIALYWLHLKEALSNMFLVAEVEVQEPCLPSFSWSSNTILCVGVSSSKCRLCILHSLEFPPYSTLLTDHPAVNTAFPASSTSSRDLVLPSVWLFIVHFSFDSEEDGSRTCKDSKKMIKIMLFKGSTRNTDEEDFLLLYVFTAPLASGGQWHQAGCWHELSRNHCMRPGPHRTDTPLPMCGLTGSTVLIFGVKSWKFWKLKASRSNFFFLQDAAKLMFPLGIVRCFTKTAGAGTWGDGCHWRSNLLNTRPAARACELEAAVHWKTSFGL